MEWVAVVVMKNGHTFEIPLERKVSELVQALANAADSAVENSFYADGAVLLNVGEIAAVHPKGWETRGSND